MTAEAAEMKTVCLCSGSATVTQFTPSQRFCCLLRAITLAAVMNTVWEESNVPFNNQNTHTIQNERFRHKTVEFAMV